MKYYLTRLRRFCGFLVGIVFFISGILKILDPVGAMLVMKEYYSFLHIGFMEPTAKFFAMLFALAECMIGAGLVTGVWRKFFAVVAMCFQGFFTLLTLALVIWNPVMDCGCFGEAIHLSHLQTFIKNIILCVLLAAGYIPMRQLGVPKARKYVSFAIVTLSTVLFMVYSLLYIPMVDFTEYKAGTTLNAEEHGYEAIFIYEKDGRKQEFDIGELPDSSWTYVGTEVKNGAEDFSAVLSISDKDGNYCDSIVNTGNLLVISIYDAGAIHGRKAEKIRRFTANAKAAGMTPLIVATLGSQLPEELGTEVYYSDYKTLISLNRSNGGLTRIDNGYIIRKWAFRQLPDAEKLTAIRESNPTEALVNRSTKSELAFQGLLLYMFAVLLLL